MNQSNLDLKISIVTPSYNQGKFIEKTILSVINQPYDNIEYIIIDGGSTDETIDVIKKYEDRIAYWCSEPDNGQSHALNKGLIKATGDIVAWINSDDYYENDIFIDVLESFSDPDTFVINGDCKMYKPNGMEWIDVSGQVDTRRMLRYWRSYFCPPQPSIFFKKSVIDKVGLINEHLNFAMDLDLWLRMSLNYKFKYIPKVMSHYIIHEESKSGSEGGFSKFLPEWRAVALKYLKKSSLKTKLLFKLDYFFDSITNRK